MRGGWSWVGWGMVVWLTGLPVWSAEPDPDEVRRLMKRYEQETGAEKPAPVPKPQPKPAPKPQPKPAPVVDHDREAWQSAEKCGTAACFEAYLADYPKGRYARMARARLKAASAPRTPVAPPVVAPVTSPRRSLIEPEMVRIPGSCFEMGSPGSEAGRRDDERQHRVCVETFEIGKDEVTVGEFRRFVEATGYRTDAEKNAGGKDGCFIAYREGSEWKYDYRAGYYWKNLNFRQGDNHPVVCVSGNDANAYVKWLSSQTGQIYRLPTEAEWEYAARGGKTSARYWGEDPDQACGYANVADRTAKQTFSDYTMIHDCTDGYVYTAPTGSFQSNAWKLNDMLGNVWEWTCSAYAKDYDGSESKCYKNDTIAPLAVRGGSWYGRPAWVRSALRSWGAPTYRVGDLGFRLARSL